MNGEQPLQTAGVSGKLAHHSPPFPGGTRRCGSALNDSWTEDRLRLKRCPFRQRVVMHDLRCCAGSSGSFRPPRSMSKSFSCWSSGSRAASRPLDGPGWISGMSWSWGWCAWPWMVMMTDWHTWSTLTRDCGALWAWSPTSVGSLAKAFIKRP